MAIKNQKLYSIFYVVYQQVISLWIKRTSQPDLFEIWQSVIHIPFKNPWFPLQLCCHQCVFLSIFRIRLHLKQFGSQVDNKKGQRIILPDSVRFSCSKAFGFQAQTIISWSAVTLHPPTPPHPLNMLECQVVGERLHTSHLRA